MKQAAEGIKNYNPTPEPAMHEASLFFVGIVFTGNNRELTGTLNSVLRQRLSGVSLSVRIFHEQKDLPKISTAAADVVYISFDNKEDLFRKFIYAVDNNAADYCTVLWSGEELFEGAFASTAGIFKKYAEVNWLTGIQTFRAQGGYNITTGSTALRRWSYKIYERNLYKNSGRFIPPASTFWRKSIWNSVTPGLHFVGQRDFCEDLWLSLFKTQRLYTCKIYFSTTQMYDKLHKSGIKRPNSPALIEDKPANKIKEFFFINNIPYLRFFYRTESDFAPIIRFDHNTQSYFLSEY